METTLQRKQAMNHQLHALLEKLPANKVEELLDYGAFLLSRIQTKPSQQQQNLADRFAGVWLDDRTADEIIADIRNSRINIEDQESL